MECLDGVAAVEAVLVTLAGLEEVAVRLTLLALLVELEQAAEALLVELEMLVLVALWLPSLFGA